MAVACLQRESSRDGKEDFSSRGTGSNCCSRPRVKETKREIRVERTLLADKVVFLAPTPYRGSPLTPPTPSKNPVAPLTPPPSKRVLFSQAPLRTRVEHCLVEVRKGLCFFKQAPESRYKSLHDLVRETPALKTLYPYWPKDIAFNRPTSQVQEG